MKHTLKCNCQEGYLSENLDLIFFISFKEFNKTYVTVSFSGKMFNWYESIKINIHPQDKDYLLSVLNI